MHSQAILARALADAFLAGPFDAQNMADRATRLLGRRWRWLLPLARRAEAHFLVRPFPRRVALERFIRADAAFESAYHRDELAIVERLRPAVELPSLAAACNWGLPRLRTQSDLAHWLGLEVGELAWFAHVHRRTSNAVSGPLTHYHYRVLDKGFGDVRLIEAPKPRLKELQRRVLSELLDRIPPHDAAHGFRRGRSIQTFAVPHVGACLVLRLDLRDFFPTISAARVAALFRSVGCGERVADLLTGICTNAAPPQLWTTDDAARSHAVRRRYEQPHLPQGAPTSPSLANLCAFRLDCRLAALATASGAVFTRYADDLAFSGGEAFARLAHRFQLQASAIALEEGFAVHHRKTRLMRRGARQRLAGLIVNDRLNVPRADYDRLKATLTNCVRNGPATQNIDGRADFLAHLLGRISFVETVNPSRGRKLRELFNRIAW